MGVVPGRRARRSRSRKYLKNVCIKGNDGFCVSHMVKVKCYHFGMCMSCRCLQEPKATGGGDDFVMDSELYQSVRNVETLYQRNNQEGKSSKFLTDQMQDAHMIQNANAWAAMKQWLIMKNTEVRDELHMGAKTEFNNLPEDMNSSALPHSTDPISFEITRVV